MRKEKQTNMRVWELFLKTLLQLLMSFGPSFAIVNHLQLDQNDLI
jgi:hypothetical protein